MKFSKFVSYFFHPINFSMIGAILYFLLVPKHIYRPQEHMILLVIFIGTYIFPIVILNLLKRSKIIQSHHLNTIEERKFPVLLFISISIIIGNWLYKTTIVDVFSLMYFGYGLFLIICYIFLYFKIKISLHTSAIGGLIGFLIYFSIYYQINLTTILGVLFVLSGLIASSRLRLKAHTLKEVSLGFTLGMLTQFIVYYIYIM